MQYFVNKPPRDSQERSSKRVLLGELFDPQRNCTTDGLTRRAGRYVSRPFAFLAYFSRRFAFTAVPAGLSVSREYTRGPLVTGRVPNGPRTAHSKTLALSTGERQT